MTSLPWQPTADLETLQQRAQILARLRDYFSAEQVMEVETPVLSQFGGTDVQLEQWQTLEGYSLHTSPEFAMKRLLAAGSGDIYQVCRVFRQDEQGRRHNPEFTMLEWYRLDYDEFMLMDDVTGLIRSLAGDDTLKVRQQTYAEAFIQSGLPDPHRIGLTDLRQITGQRLQASSGDWSRDDCLDALMAMVVEPSMPADVLSFVHAFPGSQAALAEHREIDGVTVARRFELFWGGLELANGYYELTDADEQARRFEQDCQQRAARGQVIPVMDQNFLQAMSYGVPACSGVALGLDRLLMILLGKRHIDDVIAFPISRA